MRLVKVWSSLIVFVLSLCVTLNVFAENNPVNMLQNVANSMISGLKANQATLKTKPQIVFDLAYKYVVPHADLAEMSKRVLPPQTWNDATIAQRSKFQQEFTRLLIRTYASALTSYHDQTVKFYPMRGDEESNTVEVNSEIKGGGNDAIHVTYRLLRHGGDWRLYDMSVEGVSMLESFRDQFADILSRGDMNQLIAQLAAHTHH